jgi:hypothetical protein
LSDDFGVFLIGRGKPAEFGAGFFVGSPVEGGELGSAFGCGCEDMLPPVCLGDIPRHQAAFPKTGDEPADVARIEAEFLAELR